MISTVYTETKNDIWLIRQGVPQQRYANYTGHRAKKICKKTVKLHMTTTTMAEVKTSLKIL